MSSGLYGVIGDPISHSLSPVIHRGWMRDLGIDADYKAFHVRAGTLCDGLEAFEREGVRGLNVTLPHKIDVVPICERMSPLAETLGAVNTLSRTPSGGWVGDNTDYQGFLDDFRDVSRGALEACRILVLGAGGAAQAVARALRDRGFVVCIANRTVSRAGALAASLGLPSEAARGLDDVATLSEQVDAIVNTLALGHARDAVRFADGGGRLFYDISYGSVAVPALDAATDAGWRSADGLGMLVAQAAISFEIWHGVSPDRTAALKRCRAALDMAK